MNDKVIKIISVILGIFLSSSLLSGVGRQGGDQKYGMTCNGAEDSLRLLILGSHSIQCRGKSELKTNLF